MRGFYDKTARAAEFSRGVTVRDPARLGASSGEWGGNDGEPRAARLGASLGERGENDGELRTVRIGLVFFSASGAAS